MPPVRAMTLSVHELRDFAPGHGQPVRKRGLAALGNLPLFRKFGGPALRSAFTMMAVLSIALLVWSLVKAPPHKPKSDSARAAWADRDDPYWNEDPARPRTAAERFNAWAASAVSGLFGGSGKSRGRDGDLGGRGLNSGIDIFNHPSKGAAPIAGTGGGNFDGSTLFGAKGQAARPGGPAKPGFTPLPGTAPTAKPAFREVSPEAIPAPPQQAARRVDTARPGEAQARMETASRAPPSLPRTALAPQPAPMQPATSAAASAASPVQPARQAAPAGALPPHQAQSPQPEVSLAPLNPGAADYSPVSAALRAAQADFRHFDKARAAVQGLVERQPNSPVRADFEAQLATLTDMRRSAVIERTSIDAGKDKFEAVKISDPVSVSIAGCLQGLGTVSSAIIARKNVDIQPLIPSFFVIAHVAAGVPREEITGQIHNCIAPLHQMGTAALFVGAAAAGGQAVADKLSMTPGAMVWEP